MQRQLNFIDHLLASADNALRTVLGSHINHAGRPNPARDLPETVTDERERQHSAGLMRVNHAGEIAAQALYQGQSVFARDATVRESMRQSAEEEVDHLAWCEERLAELGSAPSKLAPFWYAGSFAIGALAGAAGDRWSLGFVAETERQVEAHLDSHLERLPEHDARSRAIVEQMKIDEIHHGEKAMQLGAARLPWPIRRLMRLTSKVMTTTAYRL
ncbi:MAG TPA: 2-polyprenyl-3-methyl-6-methoxy-1,4-benzoquinone monooxygenase [Gammaproteobacteria bacterium]|nr:2-polyprenyl-3-methyl-6-methoxy-1,4-benzoquinone monooxygenase [Gammaproteobacteria bacterium]